jgi:glycine betaine/proline transport system substrate-binding protein
LSAGYNSLNARSKFRIPAPSCRCSTARVKRAGAALALLALLGALTARAAPAEPPSCRQVRFSDVGWTDVTSTTALTAELMRAIGYTPTITVLSVPVTFASLKNKDIDVFLGNWMPAQTADRAPYTADGSVSVVGPNLVGAKYTLAVPAYQYERGLRDFNDIHRFASQLNASPRSSTIPFTASSRATTATVSCSKC